MSIPIVYISLSKELYHAHAHVIRHALDNGVFPLLPGQVLDYHSDPDQVDTSRLWEQLDEVWIYVAGAEAAELWQLFTGRKKRIWDITNVDNILELTADGSVETVPKKKLRVRTKLKPVVPISPIVPVSLDVECVFSEAQLARVSAQETEYYEHLDYDPDGILNIYTDGSTYNNGRPNATGGYGVFIADPEINNISMVLVGGKITNNVAELKAMICALKFILSREGGGSGSDAGGGGSYYAIHYDSEYAYDVTSGNKNAHSNLSLVKESKDMLSKCRGTSATIRFSHIRSHTGKKDMHSLGNEVADTLAG